VHGYQAVLIRKHYTELSKAGGLIDVSREMLLGTGATWNASLHRWTSPEGAILEFGHLENDSALEKYQSTEYQFIGTDEVTELELNQYQFLFSRMRKPVWLKEIPLRMRSASNPRGPGAPWVKQRFLVEGRANGRLFIPAKLWDNPYIDKESYVKSLMNLDPFTREQLLAGNWDAKPPGGKFRREWFGFVDAVPADARKVRYWDLAATEPKLGKDPSWTVGLLMAEHNDFFYLVDIRRVQEAPRGVEQLILHTAAMDGDEVDIWMEEEGGSSGKNTTDHYTRVLQKYSFHAQRATGSKEVRSNPVSSQAEAGNIKLLKDREWMNAFLDEIEIFPHGQHDDQVDAMSGAYHALVDNAGDDYMFLGGERARPDW